MRVRLRGRSCVFTLVGMLAAREGCTRLIVGMELTDFASGRLPINWRHQKARKSQLHTLSLEIRAISRPRFLFSTPMPLWPLFIVHGDGSSAPHSSASFVQLTPISQRVSSHGENTDHTPATFYLLMLQEVESRQCIVEIKIPLKKYLPGPPTSTSGG